ncbi:MAG: hypothetical protein QW334_01650 [Thermofilum sp.]
MEEGLPDDFDFWVTRAEFGYLPEYTDQSGAQVPLLIWYGESPDGVEIEHIGWSLGKGWEPIKGGKEVRHQSNKDKFVKTSMYGRLIQRVHELGVDMSRRGSAKIASVWEGLGFHMKREEIEFKGLLEERGGKTSRLMPVAFLGERKGSKSVPKQAQAEEKSQAAEVPKTETDDVLMKKLKVLAKTKPKDEFQRMVMEMPGVVDNDDLMADLLDDSENGFWARSRRGE